MTDVNLADWSLKLPRHFSVNDFTAQLSSAKRNRKFCDVLLFVEGGLRDQNSAVYAHKIILSSVSPYFRRILSSSSTNDMAPMELRLIIPGMRKEILESLIEYMYTCQGNFDAANMFDMYTGAKLFELEELQFALEKFVGYVKRPDNCIKIWEFAISHEIGSLLDISYIIANINSIYDTTDFLRLPLPMVNIIISKIRENSYEESLTCITKWINYDPDARAPYLQHLKQSINDQPEEFHHNFSYESFSDFKQKKRRTSYNNVSEDDELFVSFEAVRHIQIPIKRTSSCSSVLSSKSESSPLISCQGMEVEQMTESTNSINSSMENSFDEASPHSSSGDHSVPEESSNEQKKEMKRPSQGKKQYSVPAKKSRKSQTNGEKNSKVDSQNASCSSSSTKIYCFCHEESYGKMVACDNLDCPYEWFHFRCVGFKNSSEIPDKWYCRVCSLRL